MKSLSAWLLFAALWMASVLATPALAQTARIFWAAGDFPASPGEIGVINEDGTGLQTIHTGLDFVENIDVDPANQHIYWNERRRIFNNGPWASMIRRSDFNGGNIVTLVTVQNEISGLSLDLVNNKMYWTQGNPGGPSLEQSDLTGANQQTIQSGLFTPALEADPAAGKVFWGTQSSIRSSGLNGGPQQILHTNTGDQILGLTVDPAQDVYWTSAAFLTPGLRSGDQAGTNFAPIAVPNSSKPLGIDYEPTIDRVFWTEKDFGTIRVFDPIGGTSGVVGSGFIKPIDVAAIVVPEPAGLPLVGLALLALARRNWSDVLPGALRRP